MACSSEPGPPPPDDDPHAQPLQLSELKPFGIGGRRLCFVHPALPDRCVKVLRRDEQRTVRTSRGILPPALRRLYDNNADEHRHLKRIWRQLGDRPCPALPRCYGTVGTDLGEGLVVELLRDHDGSISRSLRELISTGHDPQTFRPAFEQFGETLLRHAIVTRALLDHNIVAQHRADGTWRLCLIDGLGDRAFLPLRRWIRPLARRHIRRALQRAWTRIESLQHHRVTPDMIANSTWGQGFLEHRG